MKVGVVGLGRMGAAIARRLTLGGHSCIVFDIDDALVAEVVADGAQGATDLETLVESFEDDLRIIWLMVPASAVESVLDELVPHLSPYDIVIDGGNTNWLDDLDRASALGAQGIRLLDVGTSGGVWGLDRGYCLMVGGDTDAVATIVPILDTLSPGIDAAPRTNGRVGDPTPGETGQRGNGYGWGKRCPETAGSCRPPVREGNTINGRKIVYATPMPTASTISRII